MQTFLTNDDFTQMVMGLDGVRQAPHFGRTAFKARIIFATLSAYSHEANILLDRAEQDIYCDIFSHCFEKIPNKWGDQGWTKVNLANVSGEDLMGPLLAAYAHGAAPKPKAKPKSKA